MKVLERAASYAVFAASIAFVTVIAGPTFKHSAPSPIVEPALPEVFVAKTDKVRTANELCHDDIDPVLSRKTEFCLKSYLDNTPTPIKTISVSPREYPTVAEAAPQLAPLPQMVEAQPEPQPGSSRKLSYHPKQPTDDICERHGGHRVDAGRSWHCEYPRRKPS